jgi:predicted transcriptional regulator
VVAGSQFGAQIFALAQKAPMKDKPALSYLSRRESQVMDVLYRLREASVADVVRALRDAPGYNTIRNTMAILERKGYLKHRLAGRCYLYTPVMKMESARQSAIRHVVQTFFAGSLSNAMVSMLGNSGKQLTRQALDEIALHIEAARKQAR